jgi:Fur family ferric uptake transcriptional regulator
LLACQYHGGKCAARGRRASAVAAIELDDVCRRLHVAGLRVTEPRRRLVALFAGRGRWCTPQELHAAAEAAGVRTGLATVYRLIETLVALELCRPFVQRDRTIRYVFCPPGHHHHLICEDCGQVADVADCRLESPEGGFAIREHAVDFFGQCASCRTQAAPARAAN